MSKQERVDELNRQMNKLGQILNSLKEESDKLLTEIMEEAIAKLDPSEVETQFRLWLASPAPKEDYPWIQHVNTSSGRDLFEHDDIIYWRKHETIYIDDVSETLFEILGDLDEVGELISSSYNNCTRQDIHEWMIELIKMNFGSAEMDW